MKGKENISGRGNSKVRTWEGKKPVWLELSGGARERLKHTHQAQGLRPRV